MARKTLLTEAEIRSFMKLANLTPVGDARLQEWSPTLDEEEAFLDEEEEEEEEMGLDDAAPDADPAPAGDMEMDMDMDVDMEPEPAADMDMDMDMGDAGDMGGDKEEQFMDLVQQLADMIGVDVEMDDGDAAADAEMDMDMGDDVDSLEGGDDLGDEAALDDEDEMDDMGEEEPGMRYMEGELDQDAVVNEVAKRVSARLQQESKKQEMVDALAERIFNRLANK